MARLLPHIESSGENECGDNFDVALSGPWPMAEAEAKLDGFEDALVERSANQASPKHKWPQRSLIDMSTWT